MKIQFSSKNMTVPDRVYSHAEQRINELEPLFRGAPEATVVFSAENGKHVIELTIFSGSTVFRVVEKTSDMMVSIDAAASSIRRQLREHHNQLTESVNPDAFEKDADDLIFIPEVDKFDAPAYQVVRSKEFEFGPHVCAGCHPSDEPHRPLLLCLPQRGPGRGLLCGLSPQRRWLWRPGG